MLAALALAFVMQVNVQVDSPAPGLIGSDVRVQAGRPRPVQVRPAPIKVVVEPAQAPSKVLPSAQSPVQAEAVVTYAQPLVYQASDCGVQHQAAADCDVTVTKVKVKKGKRLFGGRKFFGGRRGRAPVVAYGYQSYGYSSCN